MATIQRQARALGDPTRHQIFIYVVEAARPVDVAKLTEVFRLHHNAVRQHLAKLREAGLVVEEVEARDRPGRPRLRYRPHPQAAGGWGTPSPYERLALLLAQAIRGSVTAREVGREAGRRDGHGAMAAAGSLAALEADMERKGFQPARRKRGRGVQMVFQHCPFQAVASAEPAIVCQLHLGMAEGLAEELGGIEVAGLKPRDPRRAGCVLSLQCGERDDEKGRAR